MTNSEQKITIEVNRTEGHCPIGEAVGKRSRSESRIPVLSCEGACIRGEIARLAANTVSKEAGYGRGCHGELATVPQSAIAGWVKGAEKVVLIDGCFLRCHGRMFENIIDKDKLIQFDALSHYNKYGDIFEYEDIPEAERKAVAQSVADWVLNELKDPSVKGEITSSASESCSDGCNE